MKKASAVNKVTAINGVITDQSPVDFHALGLAGCIDRLASPLRDQGTCVRWETPHHGIEIPANSAGLLYHAAQEALSNAFKYAGATELTVRLAAVHHGIRLTVADNGAGFDRTDHSGNRPQGFGLLLMSIAVEDAGGNISVDSTPGKGTCVTVTLPLD
ncbi:sensor histidine kinase [Arthrobacter sp. ISL-72]|uniref:sensor histidine kinase n=1 Tax=Arthrobacter sp. ISL-72 TaxID=2819114 RepID=UPI001BE9F5F9|nr:ATP-binding protein [Arthrobacter sp. ISL-72]MBT2596869.1 ATP-binding protein [Arthrobacter sp. ISL-72]